MDREYNTIVGDGEVVCGDQSGAGYVGGIGYIGGGGAWCGVIMPGQQTGINITCGIVYTQIMPFDMNLKRGG